MRGSVSESKCVCEGERESVREVNRGSGILRVTCMNSGDGQYRLVPSYSLENNSFCPLSLGQVPSDKLVKVLNILEKNIQDGSKLSTFMNHVSHVTGSSRSSLEMSGVAFT